MASSSSSPSFEYDDAAHPAIIASIKALREWRDANSSPLSTSSSSTSSSFSSSSSTSSSAETLSQEEVDFCNDHTFRRYSIARRGDTTAALAMLKGTLQWRKEVFGDNGVLSCNTCSKDPTSHCFIPIGEDKDHNVVVYGCPPRASNRGVESTVSHVVHQLEHSWLQREHKDTVGTTATTTTTSGAGGSSVSSPSPPHPPSRPPSIRTGGGGGCVGGQWVWVVDFNGFGLSNAMQARLGISFAQVFSNHFPERLKSILLLNPPGVFSLLISAIRPFTDTRTMDKVQQLTGNTQEIVAQLRSRGIEEDAVSWVGKTLELESKPGNIPPLPSCAAHLVLPDVPLAFDEEGIKRRKSLGGVQLQ